MNLQEGDLIFLADVAYSIRQISCVYVKKRSIHGRIAQFLLWALILDCICAAAIAIYVYAPGIARYFADEGLYNSLMICLVYLFWLFAFYWLIRHALKVQYILYLSLSSGPIAAFKTRDPGEAYKLRDDIIRAIETGHVPRYLVAPANESFQEDCPAGSGGINFNDFYADLMEVKGGEVQFKTTETEAVMGIIPDISSRSFAIIGEFGSEFLIYCESIDEFMNLLKLASDRLHPDQIEHADPPISGLDTADS